MWECYLNDFSFSFNFESGSLSVFNKNKLISLREMTDEGIDTVYKECVYYLENGITQLDSLHEIAGGRVLNEH